MTTVRQKKKTPFNPLVIAALKEDIGKGDITVNALVPTRLCGKGKIIAKANGIITGLDIAIQVFKKIDSKLEIKSYVTDGDRVSPGDTLLTTNGRVASLLKAERTALNFLQHLSGIATFTSRFVDAVKGTDAKILDTRKTIPGLRMLEKSAVKAGGGTNHRIGLYDMVLIKDNHLAIFNEQNEVEAVRVAVPKALARVDKAVKVQVEVTSLDAAIEAGKQGAHMVLLDNMTPSQMAKVMKALESEFGAERPLAEASGGITLSKIKKVAASGVDRISIGALTHSASALDIAMYISFDK